MNECVSKNKSVFITSDKIGQFLIATVFLGDDYFIYNDTPLLFETIVFDEKGKTQERHRYLTLEKAQKYHKKIVKRYRKIFRGNQNGN
jgi:hypothetical protein